MPKRKKAVKMPEIEKSAVRNSPESAPEKKEEAVEEAKPMEHKFHRFMGFFRKDSHRPPEGRIDYFKKLLRKRENKRITALERKHRLMLYIEKSGINIEPKALSKILFDVAIAINLLISAF